MPLIDPIPAVLDPDKIAKILRLEKRGGGRKEAQELISEAEGLFHLRAFYSEAFVESRSEDGLTISGHSFRSRVLKKNLDQAIKVFPYVISVGPELETHAARLGDPLHQYYLECLADAALDAASENLRGRLLEESGLPLLSSMSPGSLEDWPITEQVPLFALLGAGAAEAGVRLSASLMMIPRKSISGIFFPSEETFHSCQLCEREKCPGRKAPFNKSCS